MLTLGSLSIQGIFIIFLLWCYFFPTTIRVVVITKNIDCICLISRPCDEQRPLLVLCSNRLPPSPFLVMAGKAMNDPPVAAWKRKMKMREWVGNGPPNYTSLSMESGGFHYGGLADHVISPLSQEKLWALKREKTQLKLGWNMSSEELAPIVTKQRKHWTHKWQGRYSLMKSLAHFKNLIFLIFFSVTSEYLRSI